MINKKAQGSPWTYVLIFGLIGVAIIIIVLSGIADPILHRLLNVVPTYNNTKPPVEIPGMIRYSLEDNNAEYYDGQNWNSFANPYDGVKLGNKTINLMQAQYFFKAYYWDKTKRPSSAFKLTNTRDEYTGTAFGKDFAINKFDQVDKGNIIARAEYVAGGTFQLDYMINTHGEIYKSTKNVYDIGDSDLNLYRVGYIELYSYGIIPNPKITITFPDHIDFVDQHGNSRDGDTSKASFSEETKKVLLDLKGQPFKWSMSAFDPQNSYLTEFMHRVNGLGEYFISEGVGDYYLVEDVSGPIGDTIRYQFYKKSDHKPTDVFLRLRRTQKTIDNSPYGGSTGSQTLWIIDANIFAKAQTSAINGEFKEINPLSAPEKEIKDKVVAWRDSIFEQPMQFDFGLDNGCETFKVEKEEVMKKVYLFVDLNKPTGTCRQVFG